MNKTLYHYAALMRLNKPIGILLLLWPTLWALWLASHGKPNVFITLIFILGVVLMRSAGCVVNDIADRKFDGHVKRTENRPLAKGELSVRQALILFFCLILSAFLLVLFLNSFTVCLAFVGAALAVIYPFLKRVTHLPQAGLGLAFAWGVPMAFAAEQNFISPSGWLVFLTAALWPIIYDTMYAMVDRVDDLKIGVKSTAILLGKNDVVILSCLQIIFWVLLNLIGYEFKLNQFYFLSLVVAGALLAYQIFLIKDRDEAKCFKAFLNNHWVGVVVFLGIVFGWH